MSIHKHKKQIGLKHIYYSFNNMYLILNAYYVTISVLGAPAEKKADILKMSRHFKRRSNVQRATVCQVLILIVEEEMQFG